MISIFIGILTFLLVLDSILLILLVLIQLPKKEAGAGMAFGGAATEALFGAGSGNALTKITKYVATVFFVLVLVLSLLHQRKHRGGGTIQAEEVFKKSAGKQQVVQTPANPNLIPNANALTNIGGLSKGVIVPAATNMPVPAVVNTNNAPKP